MCNGFGTKRRDIHGDIRRSTVATALKLCGDAPEGTSILAMLPDTMERYMTTPLFERVAAEMNEEEVSISKSTPNYQLEM